MASADLAYFRGSAGVEDIWKVATELQQARGFRRSSLQPTPVTSYRRDSLSREPFQSYRRDSIARDSIARDSVKDYRSGSVSREPFIPNYRRDSITRDPIQDYRRTSLTSDPFQSYRRDSITRDPIANYRRASLTRDSLTRDSLTREPTPQSNGTVNGTNGRRGSDADDINWIEKYKRSDHHTDRLIRNKLDHEKAMTDGFSDDRSNHLNRTSGFSSATPYSSQSQVPEKPVHYEGTNKITVFLQPMPNSTPRSYPTASHLSVPPRPPPSSSRSDYRSPVTYSDRFSRPSSVAGASSLPANSTSSSFRRRSSIDSSLIRSSRSSAFTPVVPTSSTYNDFRHSPAPSSQFSADLNHQSQPYRPLFNRAPSLPPSLQSRPSSTLPSTSLTTNGFSRSSGEGGLTSGGNHAGRRFSLANISDLSTSKYRRSVDLSSLKSTTGGFRSSNQSTFGSDYLRRGSYDTLSSLSPLSPMSPLSPSSLPPPSERIFGSRGTHSSLRRYRRSVADG